MKPKPIDLQAIREGMESWRAGLYPDAHPNDCARWLASLTPDLLALVDTMRDALLAVEFFEDEVDECANSKHAGDAYWMCPACGAYSFERAKVWHDGEERPCPLDAALTAAGLPDQASRDEARRLIAGRSEPSASES